MHPGYARQLMNTDDEQKLGRALMNAVGAMSAFGGIADIVI
jgi:hypothetical protein